jgi:hypothetical protein
VVVACAQRARNDIIASITTRLSCSGAVRGGGDIRSFKNITIYNIIISTASTFRETPTRQRRTSSGWTVFFFLSLSNPFHGWIIIMPKTRVSYIIYYKEYETNHYLTNRLQPCVQCVLPYILLSLLNECMCIYIL